MKSGYELKGQFNIGRKWQGVVSRMIVQIFWGVRISEGQIIWAMLYVIVCKYTFEKRTYDYVQI